MLFEPFAPLFGGTPRAFVPPADLVVTDDDVTVVMDVPGFKHDELTIELLGDALTVRGQRAVPYEPAGEGRRTWQRLERGFGRFERSIQVPKGLDPDRIDASLTDGVLTLHLPKPEAVKPRRIAIAPATQDEMAAIAAPDREEVSSDDRELAGVA